MISFVVVATGQFVADFSDNYWVWVYKKQKTGKIGENPPTAKKILNLKMNFSRLRDHSSSKFMTNHS